MSLRVCPEPGCPALIERGTTGGRCRTHARQIEQARGTRQQRGYDRDFDAAKRDPTYLNATHCTRCGQPFTPDNPKTAGHTRAIRDGGTTLDGISPQCRRCNFGWRRSGT